MILFMSGWYVLCRSLFLGKWAFARFFYWEIVMSDNTATDSPLVKQLIQLAEPVVESFGLELADLQFCREAHGWVLRLMLDSDQGVTLDDCAKVSREFGHLLEVEDLIEQAFHLEASSPGLDRKLKRPKDYQRCKGKKAKMTLREPVGGENHFVGIIADFIDGVVILDTDHGKINIAYDQVRKARLVVEF